MNEGVEANADDHRRTVGDVESPHQDRDTSMVEDLEENWIFTLGMYDPGINKFIEFTNIEIKDPEIHLAIPERALVAAAQSIPKSVFPQMCSDERN